MSGTSDYAFAAYSPKRRFADTDVDAKLDPMFSIKRPRPSSFPDLRTSQRFWESRTSAPSLLYHADEDTVLTAKKSFHGFRSQADEHLSAVVTALSKAPGYSEACQKMFRSLAQGSLGPKHQERDDLQTQGAVALEPILSEIEASLQAELAPAQAALETKMSEKTTAEEVVREKERITSDVQRCSATLAAAEKQCQEARRRLQDAQTRIRPMETALQQAVQEKTKLEDVYNLNFVPLKDDGRRGDTTQHVTKLEPLFRSWGCEDCILAGFRAAAKHENCDRGDWCQIVMLEVEKLFEAPLREATERCEVQEAALAREREQLAELERRLREAEAERAAAAASLSAAQEAEREAQAALRAARDALARVMRDLETLQREFQRRESELVRFRRDVLSSYQWLLKHSHTCSAGYITRASAVYHDSDVQDKLGKLVRCMQEVHGRSDVCRAMLASIVCGSLGPTKKERNAIQVQVAGFVKTALGTAENHFKVQVQEAERALESKRSDLARAEEEQASREAVFVRAHEAMQEAPVQVATAEKNCSDMKMRLRDSKSELQAAERTLQQLAKAPPSGLRRDAHTPSPANMQPLVYLAARALLGWIQHIERSERAFLNSPLVLVAAGAVHSWAVVYSLFVAVHTRAMRYDGYHEGYTEHLPGIVTFTENIALASIWIWLLAGFTTAFVRILDEDSDGLPVGLDDVKGNMFTKIVRDPRFHTILGHAHSVSCVGLFLSIMLLCPTMCVMKGGITICEVCLAVVAIVFALPHAVLSVKRWSDVAEQALDMVLPPQVAEAAAAEAASIGPQLCILLALADTPGHAHFWQKLVYLSAALAYVLAVVVCGGQPVKGGSAAVPPEVPETFVCLALDAAAAFAIILSYPHLNTWTLWLSCLILVGVAAAAKLVQEVRSFYMEWLEPLLVVRSDTHKRLPGAQRQGIRSIAWGVAILCACTGVGDILLHPATDVLNTNVLQKALEARIPGNLMLRWLPSVENAPEVKDMLPMIGEALKVDPSKLREEKIFPEHRLLVFKHTGEGLDATQVGSVGLEWQVAKGFTSGKLAGFADGNFPALLNLTACSEVRDAEEQSEAAEKQMDEMGLESSRDARAAYVTACEWYKNRLIYGIPQEGSEAGSKPSSPKF